MRPATLPQHQPYSVRWLPIATQGYDPPMTDQRSDVPDEPKTDEQPNRQPSDFNDPVDEAADESFPASDPPSFTESTVTREPSDGKRPR